MYNVHCDLYDAVLMQVEPSVIITSSKADNEMQKVLNEYSMLFSILSLVSGAELIIALQIPALEAGVH